MQWPNLYTVNYIRNLVGFKYLNTTMCQRDLSESQPKFTKGEKCILAHCVVTIVIILILLIIYLSHILIVNHSDISIFDARRSFVDNELTNFPLGLLYINITRIRNICNTLLLTPEWSISVGHCVAMRSDPDLAYLLYDWRIKYLYDNGVKIIRSICHPNFNRDTFANNLGLVQHELISRMQYYKIPKINDYYEDTQESKLAILNWDHGGTDKIELHKVQLIPTENCIIYVASIIEEFRSYENCLVMKKKPKKSLGHGSTVVNTINLDVLGIFAWGERQHEFFPLIALNLSLFKNWIDNVTFFIPLHGY